MGRERQIRTSREATSLADVILFIIRKNPRIRDKISLFISLGKKKNNRVKLEFVISYHLAVITLGVLS